MSSRDLRARTALPELVYANGVDICVQTFGERGAPAILLIAGAASSMDWWETELCDQLASGGRFVIRYDLRDTGQSVTYEAGAPEYGADDLVADAVGALDALGVARAHLVGISMGGGIALRVALDHPDRVATLTVLSTSPGPGEGAEELPPMSEELAASFRAPAPVPDWSSRENVVEYVVYGLRPFAGSVSIADEDARDLVGKVFDRTLDIESSITNHWIVAQRDTSDPIRPRLGSIAAPTLIVHGTEDPLFPYPHAEALADEIPDASLVPLDGVGHEHPPRDVWPRFIGALLAHTAEDRV